MLFSAFPLVSSSIPVARKIIMFIDVIYQGIVLMWN